MMKDKVLIFGKGFIGERLQGAFHWDVSDRKIFSYRDAEEEIEKYKPEMIINCIGSTGIRNVDDCELDKEKTLLSNTFVPIILAEVAFRHKIKLVHISSGCIYHFDYSNDKPISEERIPDFYHLFYSRGKVYAERALEVFCSEFNILIPRIRIPLDNRSHPKNILSKLIQYKRVIDLPNSVTYIPDFIKALEHLIKIDAKGVYNVVNKNGLKYPDILDIYKKYIPDFEYEVIDYKTLNMVRTNVIMSTRKLESTGFQVREINEVLEECVEGYIKDVGLQTLSTLSASN